MARAKVRKLAPAPSVSVDTSRMPGLRPFTLSRTMKGVILVFVLAGAWFRATGRTWDEGTLIHPDERFLFMVTAAMETPKSFGEFLDTAHSTMNPHNRGHSFFVYGTFPLFITRLLHEHLPTSLGGEVVLVGRFLTMLADFGTIALTFVLGRLAFGVAVGGFAAVLYALAVLPIQLSHFYTVDPFGTCFGLAALAIAVLVARPRPASDEKAARRRDLRLAAAFGLTAGMAAASKISLILITPLWPVAVWLRLRHDHRQWKPLLKAAIAPVLVGGFFTLVTFRLLNPYAFAGPNLLTLRLNPKWLANLEELGRLAQPSLYFPPAVQWIHRPFYFGAKNLVLWGMGIPLGLLAGAGVVAFAWRLRKRIEGPALLLTLWIVGYFSVFGLLGPVKTMRYLIPIYPALCLAAATLLVRWRAQHRTRAFVVGGIVLGATFLWAFAFSRIYTRPVSRVAASRWIYENISGPVTVTVKTATGELRKQPISMPGDTPTAASFYSQFAGDLVAVELFRVARMNVDAPSSMTVEVTTDRGADPTQRRNVTVPLNWSPGVDKIDGIRIPFEPPLPIHRQQFFQIALHFDRAGARVRRALIALETPWDDALPLRIDGYDGFGGIYDGDANFEIYVTEDAKKRERFKDVLAKADFISVSSNRQYGTLTRLAEFPMTTAFYRALLGCGENEEVAGCYYGADAGTHNGRLGFELLRAFESSPNLGPLKLSDQRAEEAFTVYDHPKVLFFRKRPNFNVAEMQAVVDKL